MVGTQRNAVGRKKLPVSLLECVDEAGKSGGVRAGAERKDERIGETTSRLRPELTDRARALYNGTTPNDDYLETNFLEKNTLSKI